MIKLAYKYWNIKVMHQKNWNIVSFININLKRRRVYLAQSTCYKGFSITQAISRKYRILKDISAITG